MTFIFILQKSKFVSQALRFATQETWALTLAHDENFSLLSRACTHIYIS